MTIPNDFKWRLALAVLSIALIAGCKPAEAPTPEPAAEEPETLARTEFTDRVENFFEHEPLKSGKSSFFRIHLTDLSDGSPVEKAAVTLTARRKATAETAVETTARVGKVTGIYVADLTLNEPGTYDIEFHIKNSKLDERLPLSGFNVD